MSAGALVIANRRSDGRVDVGLLRNAAKTVGSEQSVDGIGVKSGEEFALGIGPQVFACASDVNGTRRDERDEFMLVDRQLVDFVAVFVEFLRKPVRERRVDTVDAFAKLTSRQRGAAASGIVGDYGGEVLS